MAGLTSSTPNPTELILHQQTQRLEIHFDNGEQFFIPFEQLRVESPSAEVQGHHPSQAVLQTGKQGVTINDIYSVGNYAIRPAFSDGHDTGIFSWDYLYTLGKEQATRWQTYLDKLAQAGKSRTPDSEMQASSVSRKGT